MSIEQIYEQLEIEECPHLFDEEEEDLVEFAEFVVDHNILSTSDVMSSAIEIL